jgi:two-component system, chemotaxis family, protein-glutamate methylesterase/glutaminase
VGVHEDRSGRVEPDEQRYEMVAVASSAGGIRALSVVLGGLTAPFGAAIVIVQHLDPRHDTMIARVLSRPTRLPVRLAGHHEVARPGTIYVAPPDRHLLVEPGGRLTLTNTELVHFVRPSADLLFESVAGAYGPRAIGCVLTGTGQDGATGVAAIKARGGTVIVEDPKTAEFTGMPEAAVATGSADFLLPLEGIATVITDLVEARRT